MVMTGPVPRPFCPARSEEHTSELQSRENLVCRLLHEEKKRRADGWEAAYRQSPQFDSGLVGRRPTVHRGADSPAARFLFFFSDPATTEIYTLSLHDALPI